MTYSSQITNYDYDIHGSLMLSRLRVAGAGRARWHVDGVARKTRNGKSHIILLQISDDRVFEAFRRAGELQWLADDAVPASVRLLFDLCVEFIIMEVSAFGHAHLSSSII